MTVAARSISRRRRRPLLLAVGVVVVLAIILGVLSTFYTELLWYKETGYTKVFWTSIWTRAGLAAAFGAVFAAVILLNLWIVRRITSPARLFTVPDQILERYRTALQPYTKWVVIAGSLVLGFFAGSGASVKWRDWLLFHNATNFGKTDPLFHRDIGFYVFKLPFHQFLFTWAFSSLIVITLITAFAHYFMGGIRPQARGDRVAPEVRAHLSVMLGLIVLLKAWGYRLDQFNLLYSDRGAVKIGASYTDVNAQLPALRLLVIIAIVCAVFFFVNARVKNWILPIGGIALLALTSIVAGGIYPTAVQRLRVTPNERSREAPFIDRNIKATRDAFGIANVELRPFAAKSDLTAASISKNSDTVENIRLWDPTVLVNSYQSLQRIKQYYEFLEADVDRYQFGNSRRQVMLAAREISPKGLAAGADTWVNKHLVYTHGYGIAASRVDRASGEGEPDFVVQNIPPVSSDGAPVITQPRIYYGENEEQPFVVVKSAQDELDFPQGDGFKATNYQGTGGIPLKNIFRRAAFAWRFRDVNLLISGVLKSDSRIMFRRNIIDRVQSVAPYARLDSDPYIAVVDGRLVWIVDGYTTTTMYPYSARVSLSSVSDGMVTGAANYIRNSVKYVVDAENGTVVGYRWDEQDPVLSAWLKVFPGIVKPRSEMPASLVAHMRYPEGLFKIQTDRYANYHMTDPNTFYLKEDTWLIANDPTASGLSPTLVPPYYQLMKLPGDDQLNFVLVRPFTPNSRQNLTAYMVAHSDPEQYGKLVSYTFPRSGAVFGPEQVANRINQDPIVSPQITLLDQRGSRVIRGNLLIIPLDESLLYVQPLYVVGEGSANSLPELKRVVVVAGEKVRMGATLAEALALVFGKDLPADLGGGNTGGNSLLDVAQLIQSALVHDQKAQEALRAGDFATYGREQEAMRQALQRAGEKSGAKPASSASPTPAPSPSPT